MGRKQLREEMKKKPKKQNTTKKNPPKNPKQTKITAQNQTAQQSPEQRPLLGWDDPRASPSIREILGIWKGKSSVGSVCRGRKEGKSPGSASALNSWQISLQTVTDTKSRLQNSSELVFGVFLAPPQSDPLN